MIDIDKLQAPPGSIWVCGACGKTARDAYRGGGMWDESCFLHAILVKEADIIDREGTRVLKVREGAPVVHRRDVTAEDLRPSP